MKIKPENLPKSVIARLQELSNRYPHAELELYGDTTGLTDDDIEEIEACIRLEVGEGVDFDDVIKKARAIVAAKRRP